MRVSESTGASDPGRVRRRNEDAYVCEPPLFAVADGMGGAQAGEIASHIAAAALRGYRAGTEPDPEAELRSIIQEANRRIYARAAGDPEVSGMGTTVTAALLAGERVALGHVGDSRAYRLRDGTLEQLTEDHSLVADLVRSGRLSPEEAELHPQRSVITRALGTDSAVTVDSYSIDALPGDVFLLCSDGLTTMLDERSVARLLAEAASLEEAARELVAAANRKGGEDNITVVLFALADGEPEAEVDEDTLTELELPVGAADTATIAVTAPAATRAVAPLAVNGQSAARPAPVPPAPRPRSARRAAIAIALVLVLFAGLAALAFWGLSRAHFVGANDEGRVVVYQGVPWDLVGGVKLYRPIYVSRLRTEQLTPAERKKLFDHSLIGESKARSRIAAYEQQATPGKSPS